MDAPGARAWDEFDEEAWSRARRVAHAAHSLADLVSLVVDSADPLVRVEAMPRLRARFPTDPTTFAALKTASGDKSVVVRVAAVAALGDLGTEDAADVIVGRLSDVDAEVRLTAAEELQMQGDPRVLSDADIALLSALVYGPDCGE
jgi:HEAT repeat protein